MSSCIDTVSLPLPFPSVSENNVTELFQDRLFDTRDIGEPANEDPVTLDGDAPRFSSGSCLAAIGDVDSDVWGGAFENKISSTYDPLYVNAAIHVLAVTVAVCMLQCGCLMVCLLAPYSFFTLLTADIMLVQKSSFGKVFSTRVFCGMRFYYDLDRYSVHIVTRHGQEPSQLLLVLQAP